MKFNPILGLFRTFSVIILMIDWQIAKRIDEQPTVVLYILFYAIFSVAVILMGLDEKK